MTPNMTQTEFETEIDTDTDIDEIETEITAYLKDTKAGTQGFVGVDKANNRVVVAYRGSYNFANTVEDAKFWMIKFPYSSEKLEVDSGFFQAYDSLRASTMSAVMYFWNTAQPVVYLY